MEKSKKKSVANRTFALMSLAVLSAMTGCHLDDTWTIYDAEGGHGEHDDVSLYHPHLAVGAKFKIERCDDESAGYYCVSTKSQTLKPFDKWNRLALEHCDDHPRCDGDVLSGLVRSPTICDDHCAMGDLEIANGEVHYVLVGTVDPASCGGKGEECLEIQVFCAERSCMRTVDAQAESVIVEIWHRGSGHAHSSD